MIINLQKAMTIYMLMAEHREIFIRTNWINLGILCNKFFFKRFSERERIRIIYPSLSFFTLNDVIFFNLFGKCAIF